ncbi:hypothetical protein DPEC_G00345830 [Dallia pectoralis]|uniref:Uncharacterized protein n=1 Tax=Dallia pectoralis TaxID=75939 RepID=A0ACC2F3R2_DALPE|nr:hypothetical protein DPEC_G00345830 [Dallia pectoralis]
MADCEACVFSPSVGSVPQTPAVPDTLASPEVMSEISSLHFLLPVSGWTWPLDVLQLQFPNTRCPSFCELQAAFHFRLDRTSTPPFSLQWRLVLQSLE